MSQNEIVLDHKEILRLLPHRYPFLLIDRVVELVPEEKVVCTKNVTFNEPFFQGHFPDEPVMPGVLIIEAAAQAGIILAKRSPGGVGEDELLYLVGVDGFKFKRQVVSGDVLEIVMKIQKIRKPLFILEATVTVGGAPVTSGKITAAVAA